MAHSNPPQILVIKFGALGDFFRAIPIFVWIRQSHKDAIITLLTTLEFSNFGKTLGIFDQVHVHARNDTTTYRHLNTIRYYLLEFNEVFDLQFVDRTKFYRLMTISHRVPIWHCMTSEHAAISKLFFYKRTCPPISNLQHFANTESYDNKFGIKFPFIAVAPFCSRENAWHKQWPLKNFMDISEYAYNKGFDVVVFGNDNDAKNEILHNNRFIRNLTGKTSLQDLMRLIPHASIAIGNDTGIMHLAELYKIPTIIVMSGINSPSRAPKGPKYVQLVKTPISDIAVSKVIVAFDELRKLVKWST